VVEAVDRSITLAECLSLTGRCRAARRWRASWTTPRAGSRFGERALAWTRLGPATTPLRSCAC